MSESLPSVTILIPALNEASDIRGCLEAVAAQTYPAEYLDVVVVDGCSDDATVEMVHQASIELGLSTRIVENARRRTSTSLNVGLRYACGDIIVRLDARSRVQPGYVRACVDVLIDRPDVGVVGGRQVPQPRSSAVSARGIARALTNRYTTGFARYRRARGAGAADTVWMGVFRAGDLRTLGGWDDDVALNEDWALNRAFRDSGQLVWFEPDLASGYLPRPNLRDLARQHFFFGRVKGLWWVRGTAIEPRQVAMLAAPPLAGLGLLLAARRHGPMVLTTVPLALLVADAAGADASAGPSERLMSAVSIGAYSSAWWLGTVVGAVGELLGVEHRHRSVSS